MYEVDYVRGQLRNANILAYRNSLNVIIDTVDVSYENDDGFIEESVNEPTEKEMIENDDGFMEESVNDPMDKELKENDDSFLEEEVEKEMNKQKPKEKRQTYTSKQETRPAEEVRYDNIGHLPQVDHNKNPTRCKLEGCTLKSHIFCIKCMVHLCLKMDKNCFMKFHSEADDE